MVDWFQSRNADPFFATMDIWGHDRADLAASSPTPARQLPDPAGAELAYALAWQLHSRITTQRLGFRSGDEATALTSVFKLFEFTRERVERAGPRASATADLIWWMLNRDVRPFTARWHRASEKQLLAVADVARRFRGELEYLRGWLVAWAQLLRHVATNGGGPPPLAPPRTRPAAVAVDRAQMAERPCPRDGLRVPLPHAAAYAQLVAAETMLVERWRTASGRNDDVLCGISLSGGGIRSATFCLGVLRQLALTIDVFGVDYLSTVSGGGYLGTLITMAFERGICTQDATRGPLGREPDAGEDLGAKVIAWLRSRGQAMGVDRQFVMSLAKSLLPIGGGTADEYRRRLREGWVLRVVPGAGGFDRTVRGDDSGTATKIADLQAAAPVQLWNMAINATNPDAAMTVALRGRTADLYTVSRGGSECRLLGFAAEGEMTVDAAMAISGAACAPTTAEDSATWANRIGTALGANLGRWVDSDGTTRKPTWWQHLKSLVGKVDADSGSAFLSDGGHVENTGLYQLLRRRCALILAIDAEQDREMTFAGLMKVQHLARVEQGIAMDVDLTDLHLGPNGRSDAHFTVIPVGYPALEADGGQPAQPAQQGFVVYVKLSLTGDEPQYLRAFKVAHPEFPHHDTVTQQSFDDRTFEAYLALGEHVGQQLVSPDWCGEDVGDLAFSEWAMRLVGRFADR